MKAHLAKTFFTAVADHAVGVATHHEKMSKAHAAMTDGLEKGSPPYEFHKTAMSEHIAQRDNWTTLGETAVECANKCGKAEIDELEKLFGGGDALMPLPVSGVTPTAPLLRAVPRFGQRELPTNTDATFSKIFATDDEAS